MVYGSAPGLLCSKTANNPAGLVGNVGTPVWAGLCQCAVIYLSFWTAATRATRSVEPGQSHSTHPQSFE